MVQALWLRVDGTIEPFQYDVTQYEVLQEKVGGWIEMVPTDGTFTMYCNEEGKLKGLPSNPKATAMVRKWLMPHDHIVGDVVLLGPPDEEGYDTSVSTGLV